MLGASMNTDHHHHQVSSQNQDDLKLPTRKEKHSILRLYAKKLGLNERGCFVAVILSVFILFLMLIILAMAITWPGKINLTWQNSAIFDNLYIVHSLHNKADKKVPKNEKSVLRFRVFF